MINRILHSAEEGTDPPPDPEESACSCRVGLRHLESWLGGLGAVAVFNLMEDVATAEISRSQIWQWINNGVVLDTYALLD